MIRTIIVFSLLCSLLFSCDDKTATGDQILDAPRDIALVVPNRIIKFSMLNYNFKTSLYTLNDSLFSGYAMSYHSNGEQKEKLGIVNGRKENEATLWFRDGRIKQTANYHLGKLDGEKKVWSSDESHILLAHLNYKAGKAHGEQTKWYDTGEVFKKLSLDMGREEGIQQAFRKNGDLFANYEAREGRIFGLKKSALCFGLEDESIKYEK